ncbi:hypothetical protein [Micromonospora sp. DT229]|uniref:hypothetical protein n=1 Tax=Micromonospora sp. DT229 TaxID=3393430 RepID=UPI003CF788B5
MRTMTTERAATEIKRAYGTHTSQYGPGALMSMAQLAERVDLTADEIADGARHLARNDRARLTPESNQKMLTPLDRELAVWHGGQWKHLISW